jgi:AcrR family transcriptional regulator
VYGVDVIKGGTAERIASAALAILVEEGAEAVSMRRVAAAAGVTAMATYRHYPNRETLLRTVVDTAFAEVASGWGRHGGAGDGFEGRVHALMHDFLDFALGRPNLYAFLITNRRDGARVLLRDFRGSPLFAPLVEVVEQGMREEALRPDDPLEVALVLGTPVMGLVQLYLGGRIGLPEPDFRALCERTVARALEGVRA